MNERIKKKQENSGLKIGLYGLFANIFLFVTKVYAGIVSGSLTIVADSINNLSDFLSSVVLLVGMKASKKPADDEHPYGHERAEFVSGLLISIVLVYLGIELGRSSIAALISPQPVTITPVVIIINLISIVVKFAMYKMYIRQAKKDGSTLLLAGAKDSRNDIVTSIGILLGLWITVTFNVNIDGVMGLGISILIVVDAIKMIFEFISRLIGERPEKENIMQVEALLKECVNILGYHDLMIHSYGKDNQFGSVHIEIDGTMSLHQAHDIADRIEKNVLKETQIELVVHLDPVNLNDSNVKSLQKNLEIVKGRFPWFESYHDVRIHGKTVEVDVVVKECDLDDNEIEQAIESALNLSDYRLHLTIDRNYLLGR